MTDEARAVPVEGDRERLAALLTDYVPAHALRQCAEHLLRAGVSLTGSGPHDHESRESLLHRIELLTADLAASEARSLTGSGLDVERLARAQVRSGIDTFLPGEDRWISANEAQAAIAREYVALSGESGEPKVCPRCGRWDSHDHAALSGESDASLRDAPTPCPKGCREKETGNLHPAHVGRCGLPTGHLGVVSCYCTVSA